MNIALIFQQRVLAYASQRVGQWLAGALPDIKANDKQSTSSIFAPDLIAARTYPARAAGQNDHNTTVRPLRVVRVVDAGQSHGSVGRMVISGRMADVCAELDRLAAREAALI